MTVKMIHTPHFRKQNLDIKELKKFAFMAFVCSLGGVSIGNCFSDMGFLLYNIQLNSLSISHFQAFLSEAQAVQTSRTVV